MFKNISSGWVSTLLTLAVSFVLLPFVIHKVGGEGYGIWLLVLAITGYLSQLLLGVPMASVRHFAEQVAEGNLSELNKTIATCTGLYLMMALAGLLLGAGLFAFFVLTFDVPAMWRLPSRYAFGLMVVNAAAGFFVMLPQGILAAHQNLAMRYSVTIVSLLLRLVMTLVLLSVRPSITTLAIIKLFADGFEMAVLMLLVRLRYPGVRVGLRGFQWRIAKRIFSFSMYVVLLNAGLYLAIAADSMVIGKWLDMGHIVFYAVAANIAQYLIEFAVSMQVVIMPMATKLKTEGNTAELRSMFLRWSKIAFFLTAVVVTFLLTHGPGFIAWWIGPSFERPSGQVLRILLISLLVTLPISAVGQPILLGAGRPQIPALLTLLAGMTNLTLSIILVGPLGLTGVAMGTAIPNVLFAATLMVFACQTTAVTVREYLAYVVPRVALASLPIMALLYWIKLQGGGAGFVGLAANGIATLTLFACAGVFFVYRNDAWFDIRSELSRLRR